MMTMSESNYKKTSTKLLSDDNAIQKMDGYEKINK